MTEAHLETWLRGDPTRSPGADPRVSISNLFLPLLAYGQEPEPATEIRVLRDASGAKLASANPADALR